MNDPNYIAETERMLEEMWANAGVPSDVHIDGFGWLSEMSDETKRAVAVKYPTLRKVLDAG